MVSVRWSPGALRDLAVLEPLIRERILTKITWFERNFEETIPEPLHRDLRGFFKLRIGDFRVIYSVRAANHIVVEAVGHRRDIYR